MAVSPPFSINETVPADDDFIRLFPGLERTFRDTVESWLTYEHDATTGRHKIPVNTTTNLDALDYATGSLRYDTDNDTFEVTPDGGTTWSVVSIPSGNQMLIRNSAGTAPLGWTKVTLGSNYAIVASDSATASIDGGTTDFTTVFSSRTILQANLPNVNFTVSGTTNTTGNHSHTGATGNISADHTHSFSATTSTDGAHTHNVPYDNDQTGSGVPAITDDGNAAVDNIVTSSDGNHSHTVSGTTGGASANHNHSISTDGNHSHTVTGTAASGGSGTAVDFSVLRLGFILCTKSAPA